MRVWPKKDLRTLIALLAIASVVITLANTLYATWRVQRMVLIESTLAANRAYATKLASTTEVFFQLAQSQLHYSANLLGQDFDNPVLAQQEVNRLREQTSSFNSVAVVDSSGVVKAISPESLMLKGMQLTSQASREALAQRQPLVSRPSISADSLKLFSRFTAPIKKALNFLFYLVVSNFFTVDDDLIFDQQQCFAESDTR